MDNSIQTKTAASIQDTAVFLYIMLARLVRQNSSGMGESHANQ
jgi:hypothetical protein